MIYLDGKLIASSLTDSAVTVSVPVSGWNAATNNGETYYIQTVSNASIKDVQALVGLDVSTNPKTTSEETENFSHIYKAETQDGSIVFYAYSKPTMDLSIKILMFI